MPSWTLWMWKDNCFEANSGFEVPDKGKIIINNYLVSHNRNIIRETSERGIGLVFQDLSLFLI